ncbi:ATP-grasp fold amidoligase family protein [Butyricimonas sp. DFI.6.44]|uniref:ATP-grasp fold amidoligase family protein n=2 Tax=Butyricimonas TaxID=574697 RepID=UPI001EDED9A7|nr:ATP-grasp fold amidoligase family protein [Butyricimonas sp. DFI.6.44]MCG4520993.1 glycosyl transferase [Butyricimonas sp. DFI.6.44]
MNDISAIEYVMKNILRFLYYRFLYLFVSDKRYVIYRFRKVFGRRLDLKNPRTFNEKLNWLRLYGEHRHWSMCADKYRVREFVKDRIGERYLIPLLGVYDKGQHMNWEVLPKSFMLKANHGSGWNIICTNKEQLDKEEAIRRLNEYLCWDYYIVGREIQYKGIVPKIVCEQFIGINDVVPEDYKFFCFHGEPYFIQIDEGRQSKHTRVIYDCDWNLLSMEYGFPKGEARECPKQLDEMLDIAAKLAEGEVFVRVDLYIVGERIYFGEMTYTPGNATEKFMPDFYDEEWGKLIKLPL